MEQNLNSDGEQILLHQRLAIRGTPWMVEVWEQANGKPAWCCWKGHKYTAPTGDEGICFEAYPAIYAPAEILSMAAEFFPKEAN